MSEMPIKVPAQLGRRLLVVRRHLAAGGEAMPVRDQWAIGFHAWSMPEEPRVAIGRLCAQALDELADCLQQQGVDVSFTEDPMTGGRIDQGRPEQ